MRARLSRAQSTHKLVATRLNQLLEPVSRSSTNWNDAVSIAQFGQDRPSVARAQRTTAKAFSLEKHANGIRVKHVSRADTFSRQITTGDQRSYPLGTEVQSPSCIAYREMTLGHVP
ncbi:MAG TPA: hypothetical protein VES61_00030 [Gaiellaceae bacterium]|nr:hypothetical protein [Gaiellaceae bacterium]